MAYEISLWVDGINRNTAVTLGHLLDTVQSVTILHFTAVQCIWKSCYPSEQLPPVTFSPLLSLSLMELKSTQNRVPEEFCLLVQDISTKLLLVMPEQRLLACLVMNVNKPNGEKAYLPLQNELYSYSNSVLGRKFDQMKNSEVALARKAFGEHSHHTSLANLVVAGTKSTRKSVVKVGAQHSFPFPNTTKRLIFYQSMKYMRQEHEYEIGKVLTVCLPYILIVSFHCSL